MDTGSAMGQAPVLERQPGRPAPRPALLCGRIQGGGLFHSCPWRTVQLAPKQDKLVSAAHRSSGTCSPRCCHEKRGLQGSKSITLLRYPPGSGPDNSLGLGAISHRKRCCVSARRPFIQFKDEIISKHSSGLCHRLAVHV